MSLHATLLAIPLGLMAAAGMAEPDRTHLAGFSVEQLKQAYLECDRRASRVLMELDESSACSMLHEELRQRGFDGDFRRMLAWWSAQKQQGAGAPPPPELVP